MADGDKPPAGKRPPSGDRDARRIKTPPPDVADQIARPSGQYVPLEITGEESRPTGDPGQVLDWTARKVRTMSSDLHANTVATAKLDVRMDGVVQSQATLATEQRATGDKVDELGKELGYLSTKVGESSGKLDTLTGIVGKQLDANNAERTASGARKHEATMKVIVMVLIPLATALATYLLTR